MLVPSRWCMLHRAVVGAEGNCRGGVSGVARACVSSPLSGTWKEQIWVYHLNYQIMANLFFPFKYIHHKDRVDIIQSLGLS